MLFGAAAAWQPGTSSVEAFQTSYGRVFHGDTTHARTEVVAAETALAAKPGVRGVRSVKMRWIGHRLHADAGDASIPPRWRPGGRLCARLRRRERRRL